MSALKSLINEYLNITGRPAATLSVEEYLSFRQFAGDTCSYRNAKMPESISVPSQAVPKIPDISEPVKNTTAGSLADIKPKEESSSLKPRAEKPAQNTIKETPKKKDGSVSSAFMLMKSIQG